MIRDQMEHIYKNIPLENIPWNTESPPAVLEQIVAEGKIKPCRAVELGCGAGNYVIYLAGKGFDVTGIDFSETAIDIARKTAEKKNIRCRFMVLDVLGDMHGITERFDFAYDWQLLHHIYPEYRKKYIDNVCHLLNHGGHYLSVCFSEDSPAFGGSGKYRKTPLDTVLYFSSESEMQSLFSPYFSIQELKTIDVEGKFGTHKAIYAFLVK